MTFSIIEPYAAGETVAFPWYAPMGVAITLVVGGGLALLRRGPSEDARSPSFVE